MCTGDVSEFTKCRQSVEKPTRVPWMVPDAVKEISPFFEKLKLKTGLVFIIFLFLLPNCSKLQYIFTLFFYIYSGVLSPSLSF